MKTAIDDLVDLMKLLRSQALSRIEISDQMSVNYNTAARWVKEMTAQGLLVETLGEPTGKLGRREMVYRLSPQWGGAK